MPRKSLADLSRVTVGSEVEVRYKTGVWDPAKVTEVDTSGSAPSIKVSYLGWGDSWDEWVDEPARVRPRGGAGKTALENFQTQWGSTTGAVLNGDEVLCEVEKLVKVRRRSGKTEFLVKWAGWPLDPKNGWEPYKKYRRQEPHRRLL